ncbi:MAG: hypothetical protein R3229_08960 [Alphaproteobacteria bacterium]|nr:hypothetical protein [Alphaproteobacteria bacterium]
MKVFYKLANLFFGAFGLKLVPKKDHLLYYLHDYGEGGYESYRKLQIFHNKRKLDHVWADDQTLKIIANYVSDRLGRGARGICRGARNGYEVQKLAELLGSKVIGTDISDTATRFENMVEWDFHEQNDQWIGQFGFVYTNSLDQAFDPEKALATWAEQITDDGLIFIEHTTDHGPARADEMDPFGAHPMLMPYLFFQWGRSKYQLMDIITPEHGKSERIRIWVFVLSKAPEKKDQRPKLNAGTDV